MKQVVKRKFLNGLGRTSAVVAAAVLAAGWAQAFECERIFRPERYGRGDTNVRPQQAIDEASWIWLEGLDVWGAAVFTETRAKGLEKVPSYFVRFRRDFECRGVRTPLKAGVNEI